MNARQIEDSLTRILWDVDMVEESIERYFMDNLRLGGFVVFSTNTNFS